MSGEPSKMHGKTDEVIGGIKSSVGGMMGNHEMQGKGEAQKTSGTGEVKAATAKAHMDATGTKAQGTMEKVMGTVTGDKSKQAEGDAHKAQGDVQHRAA